MITGQITVGVAVFLMIDGIILTAALAYLYRSHQDSDTLLLPVDDEADAIASNHALIANIQYQATGNTEQLVILDSGDMTTWEAKNTIRERIPGAEPVSIERRPLYRFDSATIADQQSSDD